MTTLVLQVLPSLRNGNSWVALNGKPFLEPRIAKKHLLGVNTSLPTPIVDTQVSWVMKAIVGPTTIAVRLWRAINELLMTPPERNAREGRRDQNPQQWSQFRARLVGGFLL